MIIAHLPAGYLFANGVRKLVPNHVLYFGVIAGSIAPDFDMFWFHLVDNRQTHHHLYVTHWPLTWLSVLLLGVLFSMRYPKSGYFVMGLGIGGILHCFLDGFAAPMYPLMPFFENAVELVRVPAIQNGWWVWNFLLHWTFAVELGICAVLVRIEYDCPSRSNWLHDRHAEF